MRTHIYFLVELQILGVAYIYICLGGVGLFDFDGIFVAKVWDFMGRTVADVVEFLTRSY